MITKEQLDNGSASHEEFYGQFVTPGCIALMKQFLMQDGNINNIGALIDMARNEMPRSTTSKIAQSCGGALYMSDCVFVLDEAAKIAEQEITEEREITKNEAHRQLRL